MAETIPKLPLTSRVSFKLARAGLLVALLLGILMSTLQIILDYRQQVNTLENTVATLLTAAKGPADQAVHTLDPKIGKQIVDGLLGYNFILKASIVDESNIVLAMAENTTQQQPPLVHQLLAEIFTLHSSTHRIELNDPLDKSVSLGYMEVLVDNVRALTPFAGRSLTVFFSGLVKNIILVLILLIIFYWIITRPLVTLARSISDIDPRHPAPYKPVTPRMDDPAEIELLVDKLNASFAATANYLEERIMTERELAKHRDHLSELVAERTLELEKAQREMLRQERLSAIGLITGTVAHELRNPLGVIMNSFSIIKDKLGKERTDLEINIMRIERNIERCNGIINELLGYAQVRDLHLKKFELDLWLQELLDEQQIAGNIQQKHKLGTDVNLTADPERMRQAVTNVINNACQSMIESDRKGGTLTVATTTIGSRIEIRISDTGPGIPMEIQSRIFEPLYSTRNFGVGLGLPLVRQIMQQHGGGVELTESSALGSTFTLWLPLEEQETGTRDASA